MVKAFRQGETTLSDTSAPLTMRETSRTGNVTDGITGPADDPIFVARSPAYIVSFTRRKQTQ